MQQPLPIWVGGNSRAALRRTVAFGAEWPPHQSAAGKSFGGRAELGASLGGRAGHRAAITLRNDVRVLRPGQAVPASAHPAA